MSANIPGFMSYFSIFASVCFDQIQPPTLKDLKCDLEKGDVSIPTKSTTLLQLACAFMLYCFFAMQHMIACNICMLNLANFAKTK